MGGEVKYESSRGRRAEARHFTNVVRWINTRISSTHPFEKSFPPQVFVSIMKLILAISFFLSFFSFRETLNVTNEPWSRTIFEFLLFEG